MMRKKGEKNTKIIIQALLLWKIYYVLGSYFLVTIRKLKQVCLELNLVWMKF